jgi:nitronate monooxygenase
LTRIKQTHVSMHQGAFQALEWFKIRTIEKSKGELFFRLRLEPTLISTMSTQITDQANPVSDLLAMCSRSGLKTWSLQGLTLIPVVQGGMGIGVSAGSLAGTVARQGGVGTISAVDLRRLHPDLMALTAHLDKEPDAKATIEAANLEALSREISKARKHSLGHGKIAVNIMKAVGQYQAYVEKALECGADALVVGAGLPLDLPELAKNYPNAALIPILSDARGVQLLVRC